MAPPGTFELVTVHGGVAYVSGHAPIDGSTVLVQGRVGEDLTLDEAYLDWPVGSPLDVPIIVDAFVAVSE